MALQRIDSEALARWVDGATDLRQASDNSVVVSHIVPPVFPSYCKLFHPIYTDASALTDTGSWASADDAPKNLLGRLAWVSSGYGPHGRRVRWRELADDYQLKFHPEFNDESLLCAFADRSCPRSLLGPDEGTLDYPTCEDLVGVLRSFAGDQLCYFFFDALAVWGCSNSLSFCGRIDDVVDVFENDDVSGSPTYWCPAGCDGLVCTDYDLKFTLIGGSRKLVMAWLSHVELECIEVTPKTRVDYRADQINVRKYS
jgi:hypothetical protein